MSKLSRLLLFLALVAMPWSLFAHAGMQMSHHSMKSAVATSAAFGADGRLWVVSASGDHVLLRHSDDLGRTLSAPAVVNAKASPILTMGEDRPKIALGEKGEIYISWIESLPKPYTGRVLFARSLDGGKHFSEPIRVHRDSAEITHRLEALAVDAKGRVLISWIDRRDFEAAKSQGKDYLGTAVYYAWSNDHGASFGPEHKLADHSCECCRIALSRAPDDAIAAIWRSDYPGDIRDHTYALLRNGSIVDEPARATYTQWHVEACPHQGPGLAVGADGIRHALWFSAKDNMPTIWYGQLEPGQPPRHLLAIAQLGAAHADVAAAGRQVWIAWNQVDAEGIKLMLRESADGGVHFNAAREMARSDSAAGSPQLLLNNKNRAFVAWDTASGFRLVSTSESAQ
ncbi:hypothetical protein SAMN04488135_101299 [Pollutimonas bauzanensis]|uniref:BNR repeat-like domain-containing protein n=2 Tax=Pollutimonas bauzanensis TaxID=658167 RepID=A0A1M5MRP0_9BURK|nr:hypothetical protein SAMN04488135_101299 [Pollutimonas bauzanensis]